MLNYMIIGLGGFVGAIARYAASAWIGQKWGRVFPLGTFIVNIVGSFFIGFVISLTTEKLMVNPQWRLFFAVGVLGAFTTFSTFELETGNLIRDSEWMLAAMNVVFSVVAGFAALKLGDFLARAI
jgi:CrcB protein